MGKAEGEEMGSTTARGPGPAAAWVAASAPKSASKSVPIATLHVRVH